MKKLIRRPVPDTFDLPADLHPVVQRIFAARDAITPEAVDYALKGLLPFHSLTGIDQAVAILQDAIEKQQRLLIVADFDTDGATSCALAIRGLSMMGAKDIVYVVPNRFEYGYGLSPEIVDVALDHDPELLITVDNGISSVEGVRHAKQNGLTVLITDHHLPPAELPTADAIVNPQLDGDVFPSKHLAGVGVMFYVLMALRAHLREQGWFEQQGLAVPNLAKLLDLVALGTVADVVPLDRNNRILVAHGLKLIKHEQCVVGISALLNKAGRHRETLSADALGFAIAPRLNAAGRLTDMSLGIECLLTDDRTEADKMAKQLDELNQTRRDIQDDMQAEAEAELKRCLEETAGKLPHGISLYQPDWHQGIVGILAARIKETFNRPVIAFANDTEDIIKGSARSVAGLHIRDLLEEISRRNPDLILTFGGHAMAAGLTVRTADFQRFADCFDDIVRRDFLSAHPTDECLTDGELTDEDLSLPLAQAIQDAGPWGQAFPEPLFEGRFRLLHKRIVGEHHLKLKLETGKKKVLDAIAFHHADKALPEVQEKIRSAYRLDVNHYRGNSTVQLVMEYIEPG